MPNIIIGLSIGLAVFALAGVACQVAYWVIVMPWTRRQRAIARLQESDQ